MSKLILCLLSLFVLALKSGAQTLLNEVVVGGDAWFWDYKNQYKKYTPVSVKDKYYIPYRSGGYLIETDGTTKSFQFISSLNGKGDLAEIAATDNYLYVLMKMPAANNVFDNYFLYRMAPGTNNMEPIKTASGGSNYAFTVTKDASYLLKFQPAGNKLILYIDDNSFKHLIVIFDEEENPKAHTLKNSFKNEKQPSKDNLSFKNYEAPLAIVNDKIYTYINDTSISEMSREKVFDNSDEKYFVDKKFYNIPKEKLKFIQMIDVGQQKAFVLIKNLKDGSQSVFQILNNKMTKLTDIDSQVTALFSDHGNLYAKSENSLYKIDMQKATVETLIKESNEFGYLDIQQNNFWFRDNLIFYSVITDYYSIPQAQYFAFNVNTGKKHNLYSTSLNSKYKEYASTKYLLHVVGDYVIVISNEKANCALKAVNIFDSNKTLDIPLPDYYGTKLDKGEPEIYGNFMQVKDKIFYWGGSFTYKRKDGKKKVKVTERVMGCISIK